MTSPKSNKNSVSGNFIPGEKLEDLCRIHEISCDLIEKIDNPKELMDAILNEYIFRLNQMPGTDINEILNNSNDSDKIQKLKSLILFASQAVLVKEKASLYAQLENKNQELNKKNNELTEKNQKLKSMNEHYLNMLSFVSHELRSPLISILGYAELMEDNVLGELNKQQKEAIGVITRVAKNLIDMIKNYLDLSRIETGKLKVKRERCHLIKNIIEPVHSEMKEQFSKKNMILINKSSNATAGDNVFVDKEMFKVVFTNIFSNAVKYGEENTEVHYQIVENEKEYNIEVLNYGSGLTKDKLEKLFNKFTQFYDTEKGVLQRGTGLGLFITKKLINIHEGAIWVDSKPEKWFKVSFNLPKVGEEMEKYLNNGKKNE